MRRALTLLLLLLPCAAFANTFTVTSNADSGPGTFREALQKAIDNGAAVTDNIFFVIPYTGPASVTITLQSALPLVSSNLIIDGTTQPSLPFGISDARIHITLAPALLLNSFDCLYLYKAANVEIYGLYLDAKPDNNNPALFIQAIRQFGGGDVIIGKPGKGNVIKGWNSGIISSGFYMDEFDDTYLKSIKVQSNIIGLNADGELDAHNLSAVAVGATDTVIIGGAKEEGNFITADRDGVSIQLPSNSTTGIFKVQSNIFNRNVKGTQNYALPLCYMLAVDGTNSQDAKADNFKTILNNNLFGGSQGSVGIGIKNVLHKIKIYANKFGDEINANVYDCDNWVSIEHCANNCIIGDDNGALKNVFTKGLVAVRVSRSDKVLITKDSFFCNVKGIYNYDTLGWVPPSFIAIHGNSNNVIHGTSKPSAKIEAFINHDCVSSDASTPYRCQGKKYITAFNADAQGNWTYANTTGMPMVFTATYESSTSEFSTTVVDNSNLNIVDATCGRADGAISGVDVKSGVDWFWTNSAGQVVSSDTKLANVKAGIYIFTVSQGINGCKENYYYLVDSIPKPAIDTASIAITPAGCGKNTGALHSTTPYSTNWEYAWLDSNHNFVIGTNDVTQPVENLWPGNFYLTVSLATDQSCAVQYGPFKVTTQASPVINGANAKITGTTCGKSNGAIQNITIKNAVGPQYYAWQDAAGNTIGNNADLQNVPAGRYRLKFKDGGGCDTIYSGYFVIADTGSISFDVSRMQLTPSSCKGADGSIKKITSVNAEAYTWVNTGTGSTVGNAEDISSIPAGSYQLMFSNSRNCTAETNIITLAQQGFLSDSITQQIVSNANCDIDNGFVKPLKFTRDTALYKFEWQDNTGAILSTNTAIYNLEQGNYTLYATDPNGCKQAIFTTPLIQHGKPVFVYSGMRLMDDTCNQGKGAIKNLLMKDASRTYTWAWVTASQQPLGNNPYELNSLPAGGYYAAVTDQFDCPVTSDLLTIKNYSFLPQPPKVADQYVERGRTATLQVANTLPGTYNLYDTVNATIPIATSATGTFTTPPAFYDKLFYIEYIQGECASAKQQVWVKVYDSTKITVPNVFSPNGDGINDTWHLTPQGIITNFTLMVFNRNGQSIYTTHDINAQWNGTIHGKPVPVATYYYIIQFADNFNRQKKLSGFVVIIR